MHDIFDSQRKLLKEARIHGSPLLPLANYDNYRRFPQYSRYSIDVHWHDEMELLTLTEGKAQFRIDDEVFEIDRGDTVIIPPGAIHSAESIQGIPFHFETIVFNPQILHSSIADQCTLEYINPILSGHTGFKNPITASETEETSLLAYHLDILKAIELNEEKSTGYIIGLKSMIMTILFHLYRDNFVHSSVENQKNRLTMKRLKPVLTYIQKNYASKISEDKLAQISNWSKFHFIKIFKKITGRTPIDYINYYRVLVAQRLLAQTDDKIITIAFTVGFNDLSYFYRVFERYSGKTPGTFRE